MGREHWTKGRNKFLWNTGVLTHDFVGHCSSNTEYKNLESLQTVLKAEGKCWQSYPNDGLVHKVWCSGIPGAKGRSCYSCNDVDV